MRVERRHHPATSWRPDLGRLAGRLEAELRARASPWPDVGAAATVARGLAGMTAEKWAAEHGMTEDEVHQMEVGQRTWDELPATVRQALAHDSTEVGR